MDNYIADNYGGRGSSNHNSMGGGGHFNTASNQNNSMNTGFEDLYANEQLQNVRPQQVNQTPKITQFINKGPSNSAIANRMAELRAAQQSNTRSLSSGPQRGRKGQIRKQAHTQWNNQCIIHNVSLPQLISSATCSKRYKVKFTWIDQQGRPHQQDINFGGEGKAQFIDHKDPSLRDVRVAQLKQQTLINPLHPNFWKFNLLNKYPDINVAYYKFVQENNLTNRKAFMKKDFKNQNANTIARPSAPQQVLNHNLPQNNSMMESLDQFRFKV